MNLIPIFISFNDCIRESKNRNKDDILRSNKNYYFFIVTGQAYVGNK